MIRQVCVVHTILFCKFMKNKTNSQMFYTFFIIRSEFCMSSLFDVRNNA